MHLEHIETPILIMTTSFSTMSLSMADYKLADGFVVCVFQARNIQTGELAAVKIIKLEPGKNHRLLLFSGFPITGLSSFIFSELINGKKSGK